ncbi:MAG: VOC family protein [Thermomicrobiales bacterium]
MANPVIYFEIAGPDPQMLREFYGSVFGWEIDEINDGYAPIAAGDDRGIKGGILKTLAPRVTVYVDVEDLKMALERAVELGGTVLMPWTDYGEVLIAQIADPAGNLIALSQHR